MPLEVVALFAHKAPEDLGFLAHRTPRVEARLLDEIPLFVGPESELALLLTSEERQAAAAARAGLLLRCDDGTPSSARLSASVDHILRCRELGAVAIVLPAARKVIGPSALAALAPALSSTKGQLKLFVQFHVVQDDRHAWSHTHGMAHYGLPDLECRTTLENREFAARLLQAGMAHLMKQGPDALVLGSVMEAIEPDGRSLGRFEVCAPLAVEGHSYDAWGALQMLPLPAEAADEGPLEEHRMDTLSQLRLFIANRLRAHDIDLHEAQLAAANLCGLSADRLDLSWANLRGATLRDARLGDCLLRGAWLEDSDWSGATLRVCVLDDARVAGACFDSARIEDSSAKGADLTGASLRGTKLTETSFERAVLRGAVFDDAEGEGVEFRGADLAGASLIGVRLDEADFRGANLQGADLSRGRFHSADFRGAILEGSRFDDADCAGARCDEGAGPRPNSASNADAKAAASFDEFANSALRLGMAALPGVFAAREDATAEFLEGVQRTVDALGAAADRPPEEWKPWLEALANIKAGSGPIDRKAVLAALGEGPPGLRNALAARGIPIAQLQERLQHLFSALDANSDQPPEEWKPWLEPLMKMVNEGQALDLKLVFEALSSLTQRPPPKPGGPPTS
ncbi:MAG: pentapeptide repeat-containing protein [Burkholderiales bacterium]|nr:pentapeptide repeat-containing protein [Burkholderiales bacterium]